MKTNEHREKDTGWALSLLLCVQFSLHYVLIHPPTLLASEQALLHVTAGLLGTADFQVCYNDKPLNDTKQ